MHITTGSDKSIASALKRSHVIFQLSKLQHRDVNM